MFGFVARYFTDAEVRPPKFLHGIEPSQVCRWHPRKRGSRAGGPRCEPNPQTAYRIRGRGTSKNLHRDSRLLIEIGSTSRQHRMFRMFGPLELPGELVDLFLWLSVLVVLKRPSQLV